MSRELRDEKSAKKMPNVGSTTASSSFSVSFFSPTSEAKHQTTNNLLMQNILILRQQFRLLDQQMREQNVQVSNAFTAYINQCMAASGAIRLMLPKPNIAEFTPEISKAYFILRDAITALDHECVHLTDSLQGILKIRKILDALEGIELAFKNFKSHIVMKSSILPAVTELPATVKGKTS